MLEIKGDSDTITSNYPPPKKKGKEKKAQRSLNILLKKHFLYLIRDTQVSLFQKVDIYCVLSMCRARNRDYLI